MSMNCNEHYKALLQEVESYRDRYKSDKSVLERRKQYNSLMEMEENLEPAQFSLDLSGWHFECLYQRTENLGEHLFVMFNGLRTLKTHFRRFIRWSYFGLCPGTMLTIDDPMIYRHKELLLGWMYGDEHTSVAELAVEIVKAVCRREGRSYNKVIFFGSSGGGYDAIYCASLLPDSLSVCLNPQIRLENYPYSKDFSEITGINLQDRDIFHRNDLAPVIQKSSSKHVILSNVASRPDLVGHILPLCHELGIAPCFGLTEKGNVLMWLYDCQATNASPHNSVESKYNFDFIIYVAAKFKCGRLSDCDKFFAKSMGELWHEKFVYEKKTVEGKALLESFTGLTLKVTPLKDNYKPGECLKVEACSSCMSLTNLKFAWWVYRDNECVCKIGYQEDSVLNLVLPPPGAHIPPEGNTYVVRCYFKNQSGNAYWRNSKNIFIQP